MSLLAMAVRLAAPAARMRPRATAAAGLIAALMTAGGLCAQQNREGYRNALRTWRATDPTLEKDAPITGPTVAGRVQKVAPEAARYAAARKQYYDAAREAADQQAGASNPISILADNPEAKKSVGAFVTSQTQALTASLTAIGGDPDPGLQRLRVLLERERAALAALSGAIKNRETAVEAAVKAGPNADQAQEKTNEAHRRLAQSLEQTAQGALDQQAAFADYYRLLIDGSRAAALRREPVVAASAAAAPRVVNGAPAPASGLRPLPAVPVSRYVGAWSYSTASPVFHGAEPEFVDLAVREASGQVNGNLYVRFKSPRGAPGDWIVRFDFSGPLQTSRYQSFPLETAEGLKGRIDLIPGPAFNLLEIAFETDPKPGKIHLGNFILVKK